MAANKTPTIYDVAQRAGVSITTVSRMLNAPDKVNPETRDRILAAIDVLGFVPKAEARARALRQTGRIGVITPFFTAPSFVQRLRGVASVLSKSNYELVIYPVETLDHLQGYLSSIPVMRNLDGLIIMSMAIDSQDARRLIDNGMQTVLIEYQHPELSSIVINDFEGGRLVGERILSKGHRVVGFIGDIEPPERLQIHPVLSRLKGLQAVLETAGIPLREAYVRRSPYMQEESKQAARELLSLPEPPTVIFAAADVQALAGLKVAREMRLKVPEQLAVIGFDDIDSADYLDLTTIRQHLDESGKLAVEILLSHIADPARPPQHVNLPLVLVERETA
jgi:LacI family transcriptional regulator